MSSSSSASSSLSSNTNVTHPKIQTESKHDILYLQSILTSHALSSPLLTSRSQQDRDTLTERIQSWISSIFTIAKPNILINGIEYDEAFKEIVEYEPTSEELAQKLANIHAQVTGLQVAMAHMRTSVPMAVRDLVERECALATECSNAQSVSLGDVDKSSVEETSGNLDYSRLSDVYKTVVTRPAALNATLQGTCDKLTRAQEIVGQKGQEVLEDKENLGGEELSSVTPRRARTGLLTSLGVPV
ncbi:uncharacterized protein SPPG_00627 [Spizellomyces punctatus DAOM BR117]|uniref:Uncharacterized protein n=1 Tax=Spizellomyces punctatus (strain DAOM BR117) TaxID=645134 RepID=A0A0L0HV19_SPIPD|nr:uncharacterized protein SPPG_00627 [Spizellomyces punctatus DAOM BR117]KND04937.1 hypothetical protein SPPG_00627 [Spizellomyces punctatus DAOM BR117]|eukprot:XP_016612976.1 hypothetical protein SPPG_00627 [Spizellomyces punctatus DAOM BR117]